MKMPVFYNEKQNALVQSDCLEDRSFSPSPGKPVLVLESMLQAGLPIEVKDFKPLDLETIALAHSKHYVRGVMCLELPNGFCNRSPSVAASLPWTTGSLLAAAEFAARTGTSCASLTSGFHHAGYKRGHGFCTFNGLMIAALHLKEQGFKKIGIIDLDMHFGDGTEEIIKKKKTNFIKHYTFGKHGVTPATAEAWLEKLPGIVKGFKGFDVILFQAGADPHIDDPLGGVLTSEQMRRRDRIVFEVAHRLQVPVVYLLAGGYQTPIRKVLDLHDATAQECIEINYKEEKTHG